MLTRSTFLGEGKILRNRHVEIAMIQANPLMAFPYSSIMQQSVEYTIKVLELDFSHISTIRPDLLLREDYAGALVEAFPIRLGWAMEGEDSGLSKLLSRDGVFTSSCLSYDALAPGALVKLLHHWLTHPETVRDFPAHVSRAARNWEFEFNHERALNNVRRALGFAQRYVSAQMVCNLLEHIYKWDRNTARLHTVCRAASQHPWPTRLHLPFKVQTTCWDLLGTC